METKFHAVGIRRMAYQIALPRLLKEALVGQQNFTTHLADVLAPVIADFLLCSGCFLMK
jgi:hypothetical protein